MDVTNPGQVSVEAETYGNPDPNGGQARWRPRELDVLIAAAGEAFPRPDNDVDASTFSTPVEVDVDQLLSLPPVLYSPRPDAVEVDVASQSIGQGGMVPVDPLDPAAGTMFLEPAEYVVVGPAESFQTNATELDQVTVAVVAVLDADNLPNPAGPTTTRYYLVLAPPSLTSYPVSLLGRQIVFADDTLTVADQGAARTITNYGGNFIVIDRDDQSANNGTVPTMVAPQAGDAFTLDVNRQGSEQVNVEGGITDVFIFPPPPVDVPYPQQGLAGSGTYDVSTGPQPGSPIIASGVGIPTAINVDVSNQSPVVGLPREVYV